MKNIVRFFRWAFEPMDPEQDIRHMNIVFAKRVGILLAWVAITFSTTMTVFLIYTIIKSC